MHDIKGRPIKELRFFPI